MSVDEKIHNDSSGELSLTIQFVKQELLNMLIKKKELIIKLGQQFEKVVSNRETICEEIKRVLEDEIIRRLISSRTIEQYCPAEWKRRTRPKNEKIAISMQRNRISPLIIGVDGQVIQEFNDKLPDSLPTKGSVVSLEIPIPYEKLQRFMADLFKIHGLMEPVLIQVSIDIKNGKILSTSLGRGGDRISQEYDTSSES